MGGRRGAAVGRLLPAAVLLAGFAIRLFIASQDPVALQDAPWGRNGFELLNVMRATAKANNILHVQDDYGPLHEDSHYYFGIARNIARGQGIRHDSDNRTSGFQPLFAFLIVPVFMAIESRTLAVNAVLWLQACLGLLGGILLYRCARRAVGGASWIAVAVAAVWAVSPVFITFDINGLETGLAFTLSGATICFYLLKFTGEAAPDRRAHLALGALLGLSFLARNDQLLLAPFLLLDIVLRGRRAGGARLARRLAAVVAPALLLAAPWLAYNVALGGSLVPSSGRAVRFISQAYGYYWLNGAETLFAVGDIPLDYYLLTLRRGAISLLVLLNDAFPLWAGLPLIALGFGCAPGAFLRGAKRLWFVFAYLAALFAAYTCYVFGQWFFQRYLFPVTFGYLLLVGLALREVAALPGASRRAAFARLGAAVVTAAALTTAAAYSASMTSAIARRAPTNFYYEVADWLNRNTPESAVVGLFQSGVVGYYLDRRFCGLDGKINGDALRAMEMKQIDRYILAQGIDYVADWPLGLRVLLLNRSSDPAFFGRLRFVRRSYFDIFRVGDRPPAP